MDVPIGSVRVRKEACGDHFHVILEEMTENGIREVEASPPLNESVALLFMVEVNLYLSMMEKRVVKARLN